MADRAPGRPGEIAGIAELLRDPDARRWASDCGWVPGTGYCRNRPCGETCLFLAQREAEAARLLRLRRRRRQRAHRR
jgi:hypothetical protein